MGFLSKRRNRILVLVGLLFFFLGVILAKFMRTVTDRGPWVMPPVGTRFADDSLHVLFLGNSHILAHDIVGQVIQLANSGGDVKRLEAQVIAGNGTTLTDHLKNPITREALAANRWDYVVLQPQSQEAVLAPLEMQQAARQLNAQAKAAGATALLWEHWQRTQLELEYPPEAWTFSTLTSARDIGIPVAPIGLAWQRSLEAHPERTLLMEEGNHATEAGAYLAACVLFSSLYHQSPEGRIHQVPQDLAHPEGPFVVSIPKEDAASLQKVAWEAVQAAEAMPLTGMSPSGTEPWFALATVYLRMHLFQEGATALERYVELGGTRRNDALTALETAKRKAEEIYGGKKH